VPPGKIVFRELQATEDGDDVRPEIGRQRCGDDLGPRARCMTVPDKGEGSSVGGSDSSQAKPVKIVMARSKGQAQGLGEVLGLATKHGEWIAGMDSRGFDSLVGHHR